MKFEKDITIDVNVLEQGPYGTIVEIKFIGIHDHSWPHGKEIYNFLETVVDKYKPDAVLFDYLQHQYSFGNELWSTIFIPIMDFKQKKLRPCAIIAEVDDARKRLVGLRGIAGMSVASLAILLAPRIS